MDSTHGTIGIGAGGAVGVLTGIIAGQWHVDSMLAANWAMALTGAAGAIWALAGWFIKWKYPAIPPLPGDIVALPDDGGPAKPAIAAQVIPATALPQAPLLSPAPAPQSNPPPVAISGAGDIFREPLPQGART